MYEKPWEALGELQGVTCERQVQKWKACSFASLSLRSYWLTSMRE